MAASNDGQGGKEEKKNKQRKFDWKNPKRKWGKKHFIFLFFRSPPFSRPPDHDPIISGDPPLDCGKNKKKGRKEKSLDDVKVIREI